jgi:hypothetical protein
MLSKGLSDGSFASSDEDSISRAGKGRRGEELGFVVLRLPNPKNSQDKMRRIHLLGFLKALYICEQHIVTLLSEPQCVGMTSKRQ